MAKCCGKINSLQWNHCDKWKECLHLIQLWLFAFVTTAHGICTVDQQQVVLTPGESSMKEDIIVC